MSIHGMMANTETLLFLGWAASAGLQKTAIEAQEEVVRTRRPCDEKTVLSAQLTFSSPPVFELDSVYGPVYEALFSYRLDRVEFNLVGWALRGFNAVYLKPEGGSQRIADDTDGYSTPETGLLWEQISESRLLLKTKRLMRDCRRDLRRGAQALRLHFTMRAPLILRTPECPFIFQEFISMSLAAVNWIELSCLVLDIPYDPQDAATIDEDATGEDEAMQLALLKEMLWTNYASFGELSQVPIFSQEVVNHCLTISEHCQDAYEGIRDLEEASAVYKRHEK